MGVNLKPKEKMFQEVEKNRWFLPNCVDTNVFQPNQGIGALRALNPILVPRNISFGRGIHLAIEAFAMFNQDIPGTNLIVSGDIVDPEYFRQVLALVKKYRLSAKVFFLGGVPWQEMSAVYASAQLTIIPTIFSEGTSLSALESMACGIATVSTNAGGLPDLPTVLADIDPVSLSRKMVEAYKNRQSIGETQRAEVVQTYNLDRWGTLWQEIIAKALKDR